MLQKGHYALGLAVFFAGIGVGGFNLGSTFFMQEHFAFKASDIGFYFGIFNVVYLASCILSRKYLIGKDPAHIVLSVFTLQILSFALFVFVPYLPALYFSSIVMGTITAIQWPTCMGWISRGTNRKSLGNVVVLYNLSWSIGFLLSQKVVGGLALINTSYPIFFAMSGFVASILVILCMMPYLPPRFAPPVNAQQRTEPAGADLSAENQKAEGPTQLRDDSPLDPDILAYFRHISWVSLVALSVFEATTRYIWPVIMQRSYGLNENQVGVVMTFRYVGLILGFILLRFWTGWHLKRHWLFIVWGGSALVLIPLIIGTSVTVFTLITIVTSIGMAFIYAFSFYHNSLQADKSMFFMNIHETCITVGVLIGTMGGGYVSQFFGLSVLIGCIFAILVLSLLGTQFFIRRPRLELVGGDGAPLAHPGAE